MSIKAEELVNQITLSALPNVLADKKITDVNGIWKTYRDLRRGIKKEIMNDNFDSHFVKCLQEELKLL